MIVPIIAMAILMGVCPNLFLKPMEPSVASGSLDADAGSGAAMPALDVADRRIRSPDAQRPRTTR